MTLRINTVVFQKHIAILENLYFIQLYWRIKRLTDPVEEFLISEATATRKVRAVLSAASTANATTEMRGNSIIHISLILAIPYILGLCQGRILSEFLSLEKSAQSQKHSHM